MKTIIVVSLAISLTVVAVMQYHPDSATQAILDGIKTTQDYDSVHRDGWGKVIHVSRFGSDITVRSAGLDGTLYTSDDLVSSNQE